MGDTSVRQIMTSPVVTIRPDDPITDAAQAMQDAGIGSLVIVDDDNGPQGILTRTDFVRLAADETLLTGSDVPTVRAVMETDVVTVTPDEPLETAVETMRERTFHHLPVVNESGEVVGVVTTTDLADTSVAL